MSKTAAPYGQRLREGKGRKARVPAVSKPRGGEVVNKAPAAQYEQAFRKSLIPMIVTDRFGACLDANEGAAKLLNRRRSSLLGKALDTIFRIHGAATLGGFQARLAQRDPMDAEVRIDQKEGAPFRFRLHATDLDGKLKLISITRISELGGKEAVPQKPQGRTDIVDDFFFLPWGDENTDYHSLFQHSPYGISIIQNHRVAVVNPTFCKLLGFRSADEIAGKEISVFLDEGSRMFFSLLQHRVFRGETIPMRFETRMVKKGGTTIDVETSFSLIWYKGAPALNLTVSDITDRKELEKRLIDSESLLRNVVNSMVDALVITDLKGKVLDVNDEFQRFTGFSRREAFAAEIPYPWVPEESLGSFMGWLEKLREHNVLRDFDFTWLRKNGERVAVSMNTTLLRNATGDPVLMVNIARDISERQASREELSQQLKRLEVLYDLSSALTESLNLDEIARMTYEQIGKVIPIDAFEVDLYHDENRELERIFSVDMPGAELSEQPQRHEKVPLELFPDSTKVISSRKPILELMDFGHPRPGGGEGGGPEPSSMMMVPMVSKQATIGILAVRSYRSQVYSASHLTLLQSIAHLSGIAIEKAQLYHETVSKSRQIEARNKELDDFTYVVSHDLKEPLISVEGYTKMLRHEYAHLLDEGGREYLQAVSESCSHMKRLIDDLLLLSRISKVAEKRTAVELGLLVKDVLEELRFSIKEKKAEIVVQEGLPGVVGVDTHLKIVFRNLVANALKFSNKPVPRLEIGATAGSEETTVFVRDNGIGIEPAHFDKIFLIFQRLHRKDEYEGVGAGLTIVRKIVESQGGRIWVESTPGEGSTFYFTIPTV